MKILLLSIYTKPTPRMEEKKQTLKLTRGTNLMQQFIYYYK